jgi:hypothetical protein
MAPEDTVYLTGRNVDRVTETVEAMPSGGARVRGAAACLTVHIRTGHPGTHVWAGHPISALARPTFADAAAQRASVVEAVRRLTAP